MGTLALDPQAQALLQHVQRRTGPVAPAVEQALADAAQGKALNADQVEQVLLQAMPAQKSVIQDSKGIAQGYRCDAHNPRFLTSILGLRIVKESDHAFRPPRPSPPVTRDPLFAQFTMAPDADFLLLFNARDVDRNGQPLLMKIVARERADVASIDLSRYRTQGGAPDVMVVANDATFVETKDTNETEFSFGDPLKQVSLTGKGVELSTSVKVRPVNEDVKNHYYADAAGRPDTKRPYQLGQKTVGEQLDQTRVARFDDRIRLSIAAKETMPAGAWLDTPGAGAHLAASLSLDRGYIFEPGAKATVQFNGAVLKTEVPVDDAQLLGAPAQRADVAVPPSWTIRNLLDQPVARTTIAGTHDGANESTKASDLLFADAAKRTIAGATCAPLADVPLAKAAFAAAKVKVDVTAASGDCDGDDAKLKLSLDEGFLAAQDGASFAGWKLVVGYTDAAGKWIESGPRTVGDAASKREDFAFDVEDFDGLQAKNGNLEIRVFDADGVPAQRVNVSFREIGWAV
jgi:hypothetical protein